MGLTDPSFLVCRKSFSDKHLQINLAAVQRCLRLLIVS